MFKRAGKSARRILNKAKPGFVKKWQIKRLGNRLKNLQKQLTIANETRERYLSDIQSLNEIHRERQGSPFRGVWKSEGRITGRLQARTASKIVDLENRIRAIRERIEKLNE